MKIKMLKAETRYGLKRGQILDVHLIRQEARFALFQEPPMRYLNLYNEDWEEVQDADTRDTESKEDSTK